MNREENLKKVIKRFVENEIYDHTDCISIKNSWLMIDEVSYSTLLKFKSFIKYHNIENCFDLSTIKNERYGLYYGMPKNITLK